MSINRNTRCQYVTCSKRCRPYQYFANIGYVCNDHVDFINGLLSTHHNACETREYTMTYSDAILELRASITLMLALRVIPEYVRVGTEFLLNLIYGYTPRRTKRWIGGGVTRLVLAGNAIQFASNY